MKKINNNGFTLIELLAVIVILAIITVLATRSVLLYMLNAGRDTFVSEANLAITGASDAMGLIQLGKVNNNYVTKEENGKTLYCFTLNNLNTLGTWQKDDNNYEGRVIVTETNNSNKYSYAINMHNSKYYVNYSDGILEKEDIKEYSENNSIDIVYDCSSFNDNKEDNKTNNIAEELINNVSSNELWKSTLESDGYRYVGTNPSNYICFGTTDKNTCLNDTDKYMYRIIGVFEGTDGLQHAKLIKKEALNTLYAWHSDVSKDTNWNNSDLYNGLNGSYFLTNTSYPYMQDSSWTNKIATWNYTMTNTKTWENYNSTGTYGPYYNDNTNKVIYLHELNRSSKSSETCYYDPSATAGCNVGEWKALSTKISLMYASDYALSLGSVALSYTSNSNASTMKTGWMHLSNNDSGAPGNYEWTMSRNGSNNGFYWTYVKFLDTKFRTILFLIPVFKFIPISF